MLSNVMATPERRIFFLFWQHQIFKRQILLSQKFQSYFRKILRDFKTVDEKAKSIESFQRGRR